MEALGLAELRDQFQQLVFQLVRGLRGGYLFPRRARVLQTHSVAGKAEQLAARFTVDVQPIRADGSDDPRQPAIVGLPLPVLWAGANGRGLYSRPAAGTIVRLAYYEGDPTQPYIDGGYALGFDVPAVAESELILTDGAGGEIRMAPGQVTVKATSTVTVEAPNVKLNQDAVQGLVKEAFQAVYNGHTHQVGMTVSGSPLVGQMTPDHITAGVKVP